jgi:hypothetical protein
MIKQKDLFDNIDQIELIPKNIYLVKKEPRKNCNSCNYNNSNFNICNDREFFVDKNNIQSQVCRYHPNAIPFNKAYKDE